MTAGTSPNLKFTNNLKIFLMLFFYLGNILLPFPQPPFVNMTFPVSLFFWFVPAIFICLSKAISKKINTAELPFFIFLLSSSFSLFYLLGTNFSVDIVLSFLLRFLPLLCGLSIYLIVINNFCNLVSLDKIKNCFVLSFLPVALYGLFIQIPAVCGFQNFVIINKFSRSLVTYFYKDIGRLSWFASEPSFAAFQIVSVMSILILDKLSLLRTIYLIILIISLFFTKSIFGLILLFPFIFLFIYSLFYKKKFAELIMLIIISMLFLMAFGKCFLNTSLVYRVKYITHDASTIQRFILLKSTFTAGIKTYGIGVGIGEYQHRWRDFINKNSSLLAYSTPALRKKLNYTITGDYKPYSVIGGLWAEMGLVGLSVIFMPFFYIIKRLSILKKYGKLQRIKLLVSLSIVFITFLGAYPVSMPNMWYLMGILVLETDFRYRKPLKEQCRPSPRIRGQSEKLLQQHQED